MPDPLATINLRETPQSQAADLRQVRNNAGGFTFTVDPLTRLRRFLVLGTTGGTYYVGERDLTRDNADEILDLARTRGSEVVAEVLAISTAGRAPKQQPGLFALAAVAKLGDDEARKAALAAVPRVARTGSTLFTFAKYVEQFGGWGRGTRRAIGRWYADKHASEDLGYQLVKYRQRDGWTHRDLLRLAHPSPIDDAQRTLFDFACGRTNGAYAYDDRLRLLDGFLAAQTAATPEETARLVTEYGLSWEMLKPEHLADPAPWSALLSNVMPQTALLRNLPRLTRLGLLGRGSLHTNAVAAQLQNEANLRSGRVHPISMLVALRTYASGMSVRGDGTWTPVPQITDALDAGFYKAFGVVEPANKRTMLALDVSGSMTSPISGLPLSCREASAALAMVTVATEPETLTVGFTGGGGWSYRQQTQLTALDLSPRRRLDDAIRSVSNLPFGGTDCALPMLAALNDGLQIDTFVVLTDNETWAGSVHPHQALRQYRQRTGIDARLIVVGMTATRFTIADPSDRGMLDVAGFDTAVPNLISDFSRGSI